MTVGPSISTNSGAPKVGQLKLEMPKKYFGGQVPTVHKWLTKIKRYFRLMNCPMDVWADVITSYVTDLA